MGQKRFKIGQAAKLLGLEPYVLRFWETEFPQVKPERTNSGLRLYSEQDLLLLKRIKHLLYEQGMTIEGAKKKLSVDKNWFNLLDQIKGELAEIYALLD